MDVTTRNTVFDEANMIRADNFLVLRDPWLFLNKQVTNIDAADSSRVFTAVGHP
jgi:hypothetical protein